MTIQPLLADNLLGSALLVAAIVVATVTMLLRVYRYQARRKRSQKSGGRSPVTSARSQLQVPAEAVRWEVELHDLARDMKADLDSKMTTLGHLIRDADRAADRLEQALAASGNLAAPPSPPTTPQDPPPPADTHQEVHTLADYGFSPATIASRTGLSLEEVQAVLQQRKSAE